MYNIVVVVVVGKVMIRKGDNNDVSSKVHSVMLRNPYATYHMLVTFPSQSFHFCPLFCSKIRLAAFGQHIIAPINFCKKQFSFVKLTFLSVLFLSVLFLTLFTLWFLFCLLQNARVKSHTCNTSVTTPSIHLSTKSHAYWLSLRTWWYSVFSLLVLWFLISQVTRTA